MPEKIINLLFKPQSKKTEKEFGAKLKRMGFNLVEIARISGGKKKKNSLFTMDPGHVFCLVCGIRMKQKDWRELPACKYCRPQWEIIRNFVEVK